MGRLVECIELDGSTDDDLAYLTMRLVESGETLSTVCDGLTADIASTGGPSSLSTLLCPLYLRSLGYVVPALAVPGRPAGGVDVLAQIPGYKVDLTKVEAEKVLQTCGYSHFVASRSFTPLDAVLFAYRQDRRKVNIPELAITSLLAKKIAAGVSWIGLDVRVAQHGNFGASEVDAARNATRFCRIASLLDRKARCFLTDATMPYQPFIGRGEALLALWNTLTGTPVAPLRKHDDTCYAMASRLASDLFGHQPARPTIAAMTATLRANVEAQGANMDAAENYARQVEAGHASSLVADEDGFLHVDLGALRSAIVTHQTAASSSSTPYADPCGIVLKADHGDYVRKGDLLATFRCVTEFFKEFGHAAAAAVVVKPLPVANLGFLEVA